LGEDEGQEGPHLLRPGDHRSLQQQLPPLLAEDSARVEGKAQLRWLPPIVIGSSLALAVISLIGTQWDAVRLFRLPQVYEQLPTLIRDIEDQNAFHPRIMGMALATLFPVPLALLLFGRSQRYRVLAGITVLVMGVTLLLTQSLQGAVGGAVSYVTTGVLDTVWTV
jgi:hypothetical protein